jgi:DNA-binding MarR family transcriptional regulator
MLDTERGSDIIRYSNYFTYEVFMSADEKTIERYYRLIHSLYSNLMLYEIENMKTGLMKHVTFHEIHTVKAIGDYGEITMKELARHVGVRQSTMTVMVDKLIRKGYVERFGSESDRRVVNVRLTDQGRAVYDEHRAVHQNVTQFWLDILDEGERHDLLRIMEKIDAHIGK